jgi:hypothetical protein
MQVFITHVRQIHKFAVNVKKAENAWLKFNKNDYNLGMGVPTYNNPFRLALAHQPVFYAQLKE